MDYCTPSYTSGSNILHLTEGQLIDMATGGNDYSNAISSFFSSSFDTTDVSRPHGYLVWMLYDNNMKLVPAGSGAKRVTDPNDLKQLIEDEIPIAETGYLHAYVTNGSASAVSFDNFLVTYIRGKTRQINHYYPYGLSIDGLDHSDEYLNKYTSKELQTGEFNSQSSSGLEMYDFGSRFYDPQVGRWFTPDPAEQFANPYLAMGNNPVMYVDPDGESIIIAMGIGAVVSVISNGINNQTQDQNFFDNAGQAAAMGAISGALSYGIGGVAGGLSGADKIIFQTFAHANVGAGMSAHNGADPGIGFISGAMGSLAGTGSGAALKGVESNFIKGAGMVGSGALMGGIGSELTGGSFWDGARNGVISSGLNHTAHAGYLGKGIMMSSITGRSRHLFGPDAYSGSLTSEASFGGTVAGEKTGIYITRGSDKGFHGLTDLGIGLLTDIQASVGVEASEYYYTGAISNLKLLTFQGIRTEANLNITVLPFVSGGVTGSYANVDFGTQRLYSIGVTLSIGVSAFDPILLPATFGWNQGETW